MLPPETIPDWIDEWVIMLKEEDENGYGWGLKPGAPDSVKKEFIEYMKTYMDGCQEE